MNKILKVILWGEEIGRLMWDDKRHTSYFTYNQAFIGKGPDMSPIVAPRTVSTAMIPIWGNQERIYQKLPAFLADSLPDAWGNQLFECWRREHKLTNSEITPLDKLAFIGCRGMGALEFKPELPREDTSKKIEIQSLAKLAERIFLERESVVFDTEDSLTMQSLIAVGTSAGGRQPKAIIAVNRQTGEIRSGQVGGLEGFDYCILKFGQEKFCSAELEMTYYEMAKLARIDMMPSQLVEIEGHRHFLTQRFDRKNNEKIHTQTLAAISPDTDSYEGLMQICRKLHLSELECEEVFRRMVFNQLANNTDDHNKNFSFMMNRQGKWSLAPAYDMTYTIDIGGYLPNREHCIFLRGKLCDVTMEDIMDFAKENGIRRAQVIVTKIVEAIKQFRKIAIKNHVSQEWIGRVESCLDNKLAEWGFGNIQTAVSFTIEDGTIFENVYLMQAYKGNIHLIAAINGQQHKYVIRKGTPLCEKLSAKGLSNISSGELKDLTQAIFNTSQ